MNSLPIVKPQHIHDQNESRWISDNRQASNYLNEMLADLRVCESVNGVYDADNLMPSPYAFSITRELLQGAALYVCSSYPLGSVYPAGDGGIRVEWIQPKREVKLIVRSDITERHFIFHKESENYGGDYDVISERLGYWLNWLNNDELK